MTTPPSHWNRRSPPSRPRTRLGPLACSVGQSSVFRTARSPLRRDIRPESSPMPAVQRRGGFWAERTYGAPMFSRMRSGAGRWPGRWVMLTCSLALVGILLASKPASETPRAVRSSGPSVHQPIPSSSQPRGGHHSQGTTTTTNSPPSTTISQAWVASSSGPSSAIAQPAPQAPTPVATSPEAPVVDPTIHFSGWLVGPSSVAATYPISAPQLRNVVATWSGGAHLTLTIACDGSVHSTSGPSGLAVSAVGSSCTALLEGPSDVPSTSFDLAVGIP